MSTQANADAMRDSLGYLALYLADDEARHELGQLAGAELLDTLAEMIDVTYSSAGHNLADLLTHWRQDVEAVAARAGEAP